jgi:hypothetical protein
MGMTREVEVCRMGDNAARIELMAFPKKLNVLEAGIDTLSKDGMLRVHSSGLDSEWIGGKSELVLEVSPKGVEQILGIAKIISNKAQRWSYDTKQVEAVTGLLMEEAYAKEEAKFGDIGRIYIGWGIDAESMVFTVVDECPQSRKKLISDQKSPASDDTRSHGMAELVEWINLLGDDGKSVGSKVIAIFKPKRMEDKSSQNGTQRKNHK